jgi:hypothetical protein
MARQDVRTRKVKGMKLVAAPVEPLDARELGRLLNALDGQSWLAKRDMAPIAVMARAGLRISEVLALKVADLDIRQAPGPKIVHHLHPPRFPPPPQIPTERDILPRVDRLDDLRQVGFITCGTRTSRPETSAAA